MWTDIVKLRYGVAENVVSMLDQLTKSEASQSGGGSEVLLVADALHQQRAGERRRAGARAIRKLVGISIPHWSKVATSRWYTSSTPSPEIAGSADPVMQNINRRIRPRGAKKPAPTTRPRLKQTRAPTH